MDYKVVKYSEIGKIRSGKRLPKGYTVSEEISKNKYIRVRDINNGSIDSSIVQYITDEAAEKLERYRVKTRDVIISVVGTVGAIAQIDESLNGAYLTENCDNLQVDESLCLKDYLKYYLLSEDGSKEIIANTVGSTQPKLPIYGIENFNIKLPSIDNQKRIVKLLNSIDEKVKLNNKINNNLYELGINVFNNMYDDNNTINLKFGDIVSLLRDGTHNPPKRVENGIPLLTGQTINNGFIEYDKMTYVSSGDYKKIHAKYEPIENDLVLTKIGTVGKVGILRKQDIPMCIHCNSALIRFDENYLDQFTAFWFLNSNYFQTEFNKAITNTVQDFVSLGAMSNLEIKIPKFNIVNSYKEVLKNTLLKMSELNNENCKLTKLRDTLLPKLMNGEIDLDNIEI